MEAKALLFLKVLLQDKIIPPELCPTVSDAFEKSTPDTLVNKHEGNQAGLSLRALSLKLSAGSNDVKNPYDHFFAGSEAECFKKLDLD